MILDWHTIWAHMNINPKGHKKTMSAFKKSERPKAAKIVRLKFL
jgi:hypothetical protein